MIEKILQKVNSLATWKSVIFFGVIFVVAITIFMGKPFGVWQLGSITNGVGILDLQNFYTSDQAYHVLEQQGEIGRQFYVRLLTNVDSFFPLVTALFAMFLITFLFKQWLSTDSKWRYLSLVPVVAAIFDYMENICILKMIARYPDKLTGFASLAGIMTGAKTLLLLVVIVTILVALVGLFCKKLAMSKQVSNK